MQDSAGYPSRALVIGNRKLTGNYHALSMEVSGDYLKAVPGQFVMLRTDRREAPLLNRAFSILSVTPQERKAVCTLLYRVVGKATELMSLKREGDNVYVIGPLGRGFDVTGKFQKAVLVAGGTGIAPVIFLAEALKAGGREISLYYGARSAQDLAGLDVMAGRKPDLRICTDDGSAGSKCLVTELLESDLGSFDRSRTAIFACGPLPMLRSLKSILSGRDFAAQVSIEERMACGIGACLSCAVRSRDGYVRACKEGPVFGIDEVEL